LSVYRSSPSGIAIPGTMEIPNFLTIADCQYSACRMSVIELSGRKSEADYALERQKGQEKIMIFIMFLQYVTAFYSNIASIDSYIPSFYSKEPFPA
jgi:hypothetical protein